MSLAWCGSSAVVKPLMNALDDEDWLVRQAAHIALTNLTGMEYPFDAESPPAVRARQVDVWRTWWASVDLAEPPKEVLELLQGDITRGGSVTASSTYRGPPDVLVDGQIGPEYWQTKSVEPPQWCKVDLGRPREVSQVTVQQYAAGYCMTEFEIATSLDDEAYDTVCREKRVTPPKLTVNFPAREVRYVRITSFGSEKPIYPTTFFEVEVNGVVREEAKDPREIVWRARARCSRTRSTWRSWSRGRDHQSHWRASVRAGDLSSHGVRRDSIAGATEGRAVVSVSPAFARQPHVGSQRRRGSRRSR